MHFSYFAQCIFYESKQYNYGRHFHMVFVRPRAELSLLIVIFRFPVTVMLVPF